MNGLTTDSILATHTDKKYFSQIAYASGPLMDRQQPQVAISGQLQYVVRVVNTAHESS